MKTYFEGSLWLYVVGKAILIRVCGLAYGALLMSTPIASSQTCCLSPFLSKTYKIIYFCMWHKEVWMGHFVLLIFAALSSYKTVISPVDLKTVWFHWGMISTLFCSLCTVQYVNITTYLFGFHRNQSWNILFLQKETLNPLSNYCRVLIPLVLGNYQSTSCLCRFSYYLTFHINGVIYHMLFGP